MLLGFEVLIASGVTVISVDFIGKLGLNLVAVLWLVSLTGQTAPAARPDRGHSTQIEPVTVRQNGSC